MSIILKNEIKSNWCMFGQEVSESLINKGFPRFRLGFNSCRPYQKRAISSQKRLEIALFSLKKLFLFSKNGAYVGRNTAQAKTVRVAVGVFTGKRRGLCRRKYIVVIKKLSGDFFICTNVIASILTFFMVKKSMWR